MSLAEYLEIKSLVVQLVVVFICFHTSVCVLVLTYSYYKRRRFEKERCNVGYKPTVTARQAYGLGMLLLVSLVGIQFLYEINTYTPRILNVECYNVVDGMGNVKEEYNIEYIDDLLNMKYNVQANKEYMLKLLEFDKDASK